MINDGWTFGIITDGYHQERVTKIIRSIAQQKIKKSDDQIQLSLIKNPDIVATIAQLEEKPFVIGFAAETRDVVEYARGKLERKNLDMIVANDVSDQSIGFNSDNNAVMAFWGQNQQEFPQMAKSALATQLIELIANQYSEQKK